MDSIKINTGIIRLEVDRDGEKSVISFNPNDVVFAEKAYNLFKKFGEKQKEFDEKVKALEQSDSEDILDERFKLVKEICLYVEAEIDDVFGVGTSQKVFGTAITLDMFQQFFDGILPYIQRARAERLGKYIGNENSGVMS